LPFCSVNCPAPMPPPRVVHVSKARVPLLEVKHFPCVLSCKVVGSHCQLLVVCEQGQSEKLPPAARRHSEAADAEEDDEEEDEAAAAPPSSPGRRRAWATSPPVVSIACMPSSASVCKLSKVPYQATPSPSRQSRRATSRPCTPRHEVASEADTMVTEAGAAETPDP